MKSIPGFSDKVSKQIIDVITSNARVKKIILFGSRATGTFSQSSDVDLVLFGEKLTIDDQSQMLSNLQSLNIPHKIDILIFHELSSYELFQEIKRTGKTIYKRWSCFSR